MGVAVTIENWEGGTFASTEILKTIGIRRQIDAKYIQADRRKWFSHEPWAKVESHNNQIKRNRNCRCKAKERSGRDSSDEWSLFQSATRIECSERYHACAPPKYRSDFYIPSHHSKLRPPCSAMQGPKRTAGPARRVCCILFSIVVEIEYIRYGTPNFPIHVNVLDKHMAVLRPPSVHTKRVVRAGKYNPFFYLRSSGGSLSYNRSLFFPC